MDKFAAVYFGPNEKEGQRDFLLAMNGAEIIQIAKADVDEWYKEDVKLGSPGYLNNLVLHDEEETNRFMYVMNTFFPKKEYKITEEPGSKEFKEWLEKKSHEEHAS